MDTSFYDKLAPFYHLIYGDWEASIPRQAVTLDNLIQEVWGPDVRSVLDVSCGIGTQALGLAERGYSVTASDVSPAAVARARREAEKRRLRIHFAVADMRQAREHHEGEFDVLISCDNSIPHLLSDAEILAAFESFYRCLRPGGGCLISVRDYDEEELSGTKMVPYGIRQAEGRRYLVFQVWEFEGAHYDLSMYIIEDAGDERGVTHIFRTKYYAVSPLHLEELLRSVGFRDVHRAKCDFFQPVIVGSK